MFSVDLKSRDSIWSASLENNRKNQGMLIEGSLGALQRANFHENGLVLEIIGTEGVLRVDLRLNDLATEKHDNCMMKSDEDH